MVALSKQEYGTKSILCITLLPQLNVAHTIIIGTNIPLITKLQKILHKSFHMKDLGHLTYFLSLEVYSLSNGIALDQHKYVLYLITLASLEETSSADTPAY